MVSDMTRSILTREETVSLSLNTNTMDKICSAYI